jgi:hypothetical protein
VRQDIENMGAIESLEAYTAQYNELMEVKEEPIRKLGMFSEDEDDDMASPTL